MSNSSGKNGEFVFDGSFDWRIWLDNEMKKEVEMPKSPKQNLKKQVEITLEDLSNDLKGCIAHSRYAIHLDINGYPGAKKQKSFNPEELKRSINTELISLEKQLKNEIKKLKHKRKEIKKFLKSQIE